MMSKMCPAHKVAWVLLIVGGLNWLLVGLNPSWNVVHLIFGGWMWLERVIYILVGVAAIIMLFACKCCVTCMGKDKMGDKKM
jgi:uncharacterized membrane protein YuzA (DUF378 family)